VVRERPINDELGLVEVSCSFCGGNDVKVLYEISSKEIHDRDILPRSDKEFLFHIVECKRCSLVFLRERVRGVVDSYEKMVHKLPPVSRGVNPVFEARLEKLSRYVEKGNILDIGCGFGDFLLVAMEAGWIPYGVEVAGYMAKHAKSIGLNVFHGTLEEARYEDDFFSAMTMLDVIEHLPDPLGTMRECERILNGGGVLVVRTPAVDSIYRYLRGKKWYFGLRHLNYFSKDTMAKMATIAGFKTLKIFYGEDVSLGASLRARGHKRLLPELLRRLHFIKPFGSYVFYFQK